MELQKNSRKAGIAIAIACVSLYGAVALISQMRYSKEDWNTYQNAKHRFEIKHPSDWIVEYQNDGSEAMFISSRRSATVSIRYISSDVLAATGVSYCDFADDHERCETLVLASGVKIGIDWQVGRTAIAQMPHPDGGAISLTLTPLTADLKHIFRDMLLTLQFSR